MQFKKIHFFQLLFYIGTISRYASICHNFYPSAYRIKMGTQAKSPLERLVDPKVIAMSKLDLYGLDFKLKRLVDCGDRQVKLSLCSIAIYQCCFLYRYHMGRIITSYQAELLLNYVCRQSSSMTKQK